MGPDAFALAYPRVQEAALWRDEWIGHPLHAHSVPLQSLATLGIAGTLTGLGWIAAAAYGLRRAWLEAPAARPQIAALVGTFTALLVAGSVNVVGPAGAALFAVCTALAGVLAPSPAAPARPLRPLHPALPAVAAVLVCLFAIATGVRELRALTLGRELASARAAAMQRAVSLWPRDDLLWRLACQASLAEGDAALATADTGRGVAAGTLAETAARRAVSLEPARAEGFLCLGDALAARALRTRQPAVAESAAAAYARATSLAPADGWLLVASARFQLARRDGVRALEIARRLTALYPEAAVGHALSGAALLLLDRPDEARAELARALAARWEEDAGEQHGAAERLLESLDAARSPGIDGPRVGQQMAPPRR